jgi:hypothetical protein
MASINGNMLRESLQTRHESVQEFFAADDSLAVADELIRAWQLVEAKLLPLMGAGGVEVLVDRAVSITSKSFPWLASTDDQEDNHTRFALLKRSLSSQNRDIATDASHTLLAAFAELLESLIGPYLTDDLLGPAWLASVNLNPTESRMQEDPYAYPEQVWYGHAGVNPRATNRGAINPKPTNADVGFSGLG